MEEIDLSTDGWFRATIGTLWFCGTCYLLLSFCFPALFAIPMDSPDVPESDQVIMYAMSGVMFLVGLACAVGNFVIAHALSSRKKWGWLAAVIVGILYAPSGCFPFGVVLLVALLRRGVREAYEAEAAERADAPVTF